MRGSAMEPNLRENDVLYASKLIYTPIRNTTRFQFRPQVSPSYGDVVYIRVPYSREHSWVMRVADALVRFFTLQRVTIFSEPRLIRRIIALPGDVVRMKQFRFFISSGTSKSFQDELTKSPYKYQIITADLPPDWKEYYPLSSSFEEYIVPPMSYFVAADNRFGTLDSRVWGAIPIDTIVAPVFLARRFPLMIQNIRPASES